MLTCAPKNGESRIISEGPRMSRRERDLTPRRTDDDSGLGLIQLAQVAN